MTQKETSITHVIHRQGGDYPCITRYEQEMKDINPRSNPKIGFPIS